jgi:hypothetical protein
MATDALSTVAATRQKETDMATSAPTKDLERVQAERTRAAWELYRESLRDLRGADYEQAERARWDELRRELRAIERDLAAPASS